MKKRKTRLSSTQIMGSMFLFAGLSVMNIVNVLIRNEEGASDGIFVVGLVVVLSFFAVSLFFNIKMLCDKSLARGDEFTESILCKAGFISFLVFVVLIMVGTGILQLIAGSFSTDGQFRNMINVFFTVVAAIQIFVIFLFSLLTYLFSKKGNVNEF